MHELNIDPSVNIGGHKRSLNDLYYLQLSTFDVADAIAFLIANGGNSTILSALQIDDRTNDFDLELPVYVYHQGKVYRADARFAAAKTAGGAYKFRIDNTFQEDNPVTYENGTQYNVHVNRTMTLVHTTQTGNEYVEMSAFEFGNGWHTVTPAATNITFDNPGEAITLSYKVFGRIAFFNLNIYGTLTGGNVTVTLPYTMKFATENVDVYGADHAGPRDTDLVKMRTIPDTQTMLIFPYDGGAGDPLDSGGTLTMNIGFTNLIKYT